MRRELHCAEGRLRTALALSVSTLLVGACGGNFSNEDLRFIAALPDPVELEARVPGLTARQGQGLRTGTVTQGVGVGEPSAWYADTRRTGEAFNEAVHASLRLLEHVRRIPPTTREPGKRTWGPFVPEGQPGFQARVVMSHDADEDAYAWAIEFRRRLGGEAWLPLIEGRFRARETVEKGQGEVVLHLAEAKVAGLELGALDLVSLSLAYDTGDDPVVISLSAEAAGGQTLVYASTRTADGSGTLQFDLHSPLVDGPQGDETWRMTTRWAASGEGRADVVILAGDGAGAEATECWDGAYRVVYQSVNWLAASVGDVSRCVPAG